jgi:hypothetical protein
VSPEPLVVAGAATALVSVEPVLAVVESVVVVGVVAAAVVLLSVVVCVGMPAMSLTADLFRLGCRGRNGRPVAI